MLRIASIAGAVIAVAGSATAQSTWDRYVPRSLGSIIAAHDSSFRATAAAMGGAPGQHVSGDQFPSRATVEFTGSFRPIPSPRLEFVTQYFARVLQRPLPPDFLEQEVLVIEDSIQHWLVIQTPLVSSLRNEATVGGRVCLFIVWLGALSDGTAIDWIFIVNEFDVDVATCR